MTNSKITIVICPKDIQLSRNRICKGMIIPTGFLISLQIVTENYAQRSSIFIGCPSIKVNKMPSVVNNAIRIQLNSNRFPRLARFRFLRLRTSYNSVHIISFSGILIGIAQREASILRNIVNIYTLLSVIEVIPNNAYRSLNTFERVGPPTCFRIFLNIFSRPLAKQVLTILIPCPDTNIAPSYTRIQLHRNRIILLRLRSNRFRTIHRIYVIIVIFILVISRL